MRIVVALGGNALLRRGEVPSTSAQRENVRIAARALAPLVAEHEVVITHGNGPQVGLLALEAAERPLLADGSAPEVVPLDVLGAQTDGVLGYMIEQELGNALPFEKPITTILTMIEVDADDPAFAAPEKPIGPVYGKEEAHRLAEERGWDVAPDGPHWRRVVPSPDPLRIFEIRPILWLLEKGSVVICAGGGGIPTMYLSDGTLTGADAVIDKDRASALLARQIEADLLVLATDVDGVYRGWGTDASERIAEATVEELRTSRLDSGSMGPKVEAACDFVEATGGLAVIGALHELEALATGAAGTRVVP